MSAAPDSPLRDREIVVGVAGGIAAYKTAYLVRELIRAEARVSVVMTDKARQFVGELTFQALTGRPVFTNLFDLGQEASIGHIQLADRAELMIVAPATANTLARLAGGFADDALSSVALATKAPLLVAPSMNVNMWDNPLTQRNVESLVSVRGASLVGPGSGFLACRWIGPGRMAEPSDILWAAEVLLSKQDLAGRSVLITSGPTREAIDPVRFIGNRSTGRMGVALARAARMRGAQVTLISGPSDALLPSGIEVVGVESAAELHAAVAERWRGVDAVVAAAAVADYRPATVAVSKLKKDTLGDAPSLELTRTVDVLAELGATRSGSRPILVGFAAETDDVVAGARRKLDGKRCDLVVANDVSRADIGFGAADNEVVLVSRRGETAVGKARKGDIAHRIWDEVAALWGNE